MKFYPSGRIRKCETLQVQSQDVCKRSTIGYGRERGEIGMECETLRVQSQNVGTFSTSHDLQNLPCSIGIGLEVASVLRLATAD